MPQDAFNPGLGCLLRSYGEKYGSMMKLRYELRVGRWQEFGESCQALRFFLRNPVSYWRQVKVTLALQRAQHAALAAGMTGSGKSTHNN